MTLHFRGAAVGPLLALAGCAQTPVSLEPAAEAATDCFVLRAEWQPMTQSKYRLHETEPALAALRAPAVAAEVRSWPNASLASILPADGQPLGVPFRVAVADFLPFLRQIHPGACERVQHMIQAPGAFGCVVERSDATLDVLYRVHAGFEIEANAAWMAPAQFEGRLVVDRRAGTVDHFSLRLPPTRPNVVVNVAQDFGVIADIGSIPAMSDGTAAAPRAGDTDRLRHARAVLERAFYDFAAIDWLPLEEGLERANAEELPLHVVVLFGALTDESC